MVRNSKYYIESVILLFIVIFHFGLGYYNYLQSIQGHDTDYWSYYNSVKNYTFTQDIKIGGHFFLVLNIVLYKSLKSFFLLSLLYSILSFIPFYFFYQNLKKNRFISNDFFYKFTFFLLFFLPSVHFWLASFSKDALCFFLLFIVINIFLSNKLIPLQKNILIGVLGMLLFLTRTYLGIIILFLYLLINWKNISKGMLLFLLILLLIGGYIFVFYFLRFEELNIEYFSSKFKILNEYAKTGNNTIDLEQTNIFSRFFYMMFRPFVFEVKNFNQIVVSVENILLFIWFLLFILLIVKKNKKVSLSKEILWYGGIGMSLWLFYSTYIYNYGLASRMKASILPMIFYAVILWRKEVLYHKNNKY